MATRWMKTTCYVGVYAALVAAMLWGLSSADKGAAEEANHAPAAVVGELQIMAPVLRETPPNAPAAAGYVTIMNKGAEDDRLIGVSADFAERGEIHDMTIENDVMRMVEVEGGLVAPAGGALVLDPNEPGLHLMFIGLEERLVAGEAREVTLVFERAGETTVVFAVDRFSAADGRGSMDHGSMDHGSMDHGSMDHDQMDHGAGGEDSQ